MAVKQDNGARIAVYWLRFGAGTIGFPIAILLHELAHFCAFAAFGFEGIVLRHAAVEWGGRQEFWHLIHAGKTGAASALAAPWQVAVAIGAGPAMTCLTVLMGALFIRGFGVSALFLGVALSAPLRSVAALPALGNRLLGRELTTGLDENRLAALTNVSETLLLALGIAFLVASWWLLVRAIPAGQRWQQIMPVLGGMLIGASMWFLWLGPWLLP